jgi:ethanolamine utilization protein EutA
MADRLFEAMDGGSPVAGGRGLLRLDPLARRGEVAEVTFSGGVAEYIHGREAASHGDLGMLLAQEIRARVGSWGPRLACAGEGIRATVIGASQYTMQVSGSTIYVSPLDALPLRNLPVVAPDFALDSEEIATPAVADAITAMLKRLDLDAAGVPVAVFVRWRGSATFQRLDAFCRGVADGLASILADGHPLVLAGDGDVGGLMGIHLRNEMQIDNAIVSVDGLELKDFDYVDIGAMLPGSGAVPVVIKSLIFSANQSP